MREIILSEQEIKEICTRLGKQLENRYKDSYPVFIGVLKGALPFMSDLIRNIDCDLEVDYCQVSSYVGTQSTKIITFKKDIDVDISGRDVVIVEDIVDTGKTINFLLEKFKQRNPKSIAVVTLLDKPCKRLVEATPDFIGKVVGDKFVIGYGFDLDEKYRNIPFVYNYLSEKKED